MVLARKSKKRTVESNQNRAALFGVGEQVAIPNPFGGGLLAKWRCGRAKSSLETSRFRRKFDVRVFQPSFIDGPCALQGYRLFAQDCLIGEEAPD